MILQTHSEKQQPNSRTEFQNRTPEPHSRHPNPPIFKSYPQNLQKPDPNPQWINVLYQEHIQYKMLIGKSQYFHVNIPWCEPRSYSWSIGYMSTSFRFIYRPRKIPGKSPTNLLVYHVLHALRAICTIYRKHSSSKRWLTHVWKPPTNQWLQASIIYVCTHNQFNQPHNRCLCQLNQPHNCRLSKFLQENTCMLYSGVLLVFDFQVRKYSSCLLKRLSVGVFSCPTAV